ncbi:ABC transporter [Trypanosoma theileri]|uniref:ABC transporter n=1 Tax=Trypanosoma theileri TaxID=67003 RepID=A0A1X0NXY3_9TRYP|nr:ABC transporter [Trypanosoma theileri]ORC89471.1 ABC transporter [Trypanosoma theileri]
MSAPLTITPSDSSSHGYYASSSSLTLGFDNVTMVRDKHVVIQNATGIIYGGRLTAVVNCGGTQSDSFLLDALAGREECASGTIMMNGIPVDAPAYLHRTTLIDEEFTAFEELTVRESIEYAASMRVASQAYTPQDIMEALSLSEVSDKIVRDCSLYVRRRVSLGKELLLDPLVLCFDQLLEGLRTHEAQEFMILLRRIAAPAAAAHTRSSLATVSTTRTSVEFPSSSPMSTPEVSTITRGIPESLVIESSGVLRSSQGLELAGRCSGGRIVLVSMIQPRWAVLKYVDNVILFEREQCVFCGTLQELITAIGANPSSGAMENAISSLYRLASNRGTSSLATALASSGNAERVHQKVTQFFHKCASGQETLEGMPYSSPGAHVRLYYMFKYAFLQIRHNLLVGSALFALLVIVTVVLAAVYNSQEGQSGMQNRIGIIFFLVSSTFLYSILSLDGQRKEYKSFLRHRSHGYYGTLTYLTYAVLYCALERVFFLSSVAFVAFCVSNIVGKWDYYLPIMKLVLIIGVMSFASYFVVFFFCTVIWRRRFAMFALFAVYTLNLLLAGIILNLTTLPLPFQYISNLSIIRLAYESSILSQFVGHDFGCVEDKETMCYTGSQYATFLGFRNSRQWTNVGILAGIAGLLIMGCFSAMQWCHPPRKRRHTTL